jgi:hypothetical protein
MDTLTSSARVILEDPLLCGVVALPMPALVSAGDLLSLTALEMTACVCDVPHGFSDAWQKIMTTGSVAGSSLPTHVAIIEIQAAS